MKITIHPVLFFTYSDYLQSTISNNYLVCWEEICLSEDDAIAWAEIHAPYIHGAQETEGGFIKRVTHDNHKIEDGKPCSRSRWDYITNKEIIDIKEHISLMNSHNFDENIFSEDGYLTDCNEDRGFLSANELMDEPDDE